MTVLSLRRRYQDRARLHASVEAAAVPPGALLVDVAVGEEAGEEGLACEKGDGGGEQVVAVDAEEGEVLGVEGRGREEGGRVRGGGGEGG